MNTPSIDLVALAQNLKSKGVKRFEHETNKQGGKLVMEFFENIELVQVEKPRLVAVDPDLQAATPPPEPKRGADGLTAEEQLDLYNEVRDAG